MPFLLFLILILLLVSGGSIFKYMFRLALFFVFFVAMGLTSYFIFSGVSHTGSEAYAGEVSHSKPVVRIQEDRLDHKIKELREEVNQAQSVKEREILIQHLNRLEKLKEQQVNRIEAFKQLNEDKEKLKEYQRLQQRLAKQKAQMDQDAKRMEELKREIRRSELMIEKLNSVDNLEKGIKHD